MKTSYGMFSNITKLHFYVKIFKHLSVYRLIFIWNKKLYGERNGNPLQYSCLENPMDGGAWWATDHGVAESEWLHSLADHDVGNAPMLLCVQLLNTAFHSKNSSQCMYFGVDVLCCSYSWTVVNGAAMTIPMYFSWCTNLSGMCPERDCWY